MGGCVSTQAQGPEVSDRDRQLHRIAEKELKAAKVKMATQVKVRPRLVAGLWRLGEVDSQQADAVDTQSAVLFAGASPRRFRVRGLMFLQEKESFRQLVFDNLTSGLKSVLEALDHLDLELPEVYENVYPADDAQGRTGYVRGWAPGEGGGSAFQAMFQRRGVAKGYGEEGLKPDVINDDVALIEDAEDARDGVAFPIEYLGPLQRLWEEPVIQAAWSRGNEAALPENLNYFFSDLPRLFAADYTPTEQDIVQTRARTIGITETTFTLKDHEMLMVDVGGQKSERRKWIHCFSDVTSILFLVSLSGYDQCLVEDRDANQMQDAMTIWDSICHSQWFKQTSIILFLNKDDLFQKKILNSHIKSFFPDFEGELGNAVVGREYFKKRFSRLAHKAGRAKEREIYIHVTTATDTENLRVVMAAVEE
ncbi:Heterotrimeric G-protein alpha subunit 4 [Mycena chlorophos]|uniref:Heterotrimeric G-protein alpha subunit 4 n=1 Tax=Mycena chlorophos TaxID=658473 RepID=A0A8H6S4Y1_MYCCL|nr:Heterotrimeric G-protein alpha subunit 4 [Mycena chlorophos]